MAAGNAMSTETLLLNGRDLAALMTRADYLAAVESAFRAGKQGLAESPLPMHLVGAHGGFHVKGAVLTDYVAVKLNGNFPGNPERFGRPTIQGAILLCDARNGSVLAIMDSIEITLWRTAAASALAAKYLARPESSVLTVCGCGDQGRAQAMALGDVIRFRRGFAWDVNEAKAARFAGQMSEALGFSFDVAPSLREATRASDVIAACTTARTPFLGVEDVSPGCFIAAVGADNPDKNEIAPDLMARCAVFVDVLDQCLTMGDLHHAVEAGAMTAADVRADIGDVVTGQRPGRLRDDEITLFDSTGTALQDVASAAVAYERALGAGAGLSVSLAGQ